MATLAALEAVSAGSAGFPVLRELSGLLRPTGVTDGLMLLGAAVFGTVCGLLTAAVFAARRGIRS